MWPQRWRWPKRARVVLGPDQKRVRLGQNLDQGAVLAGKRGDHAAHHAGPHVVAARAGRGDVFAQNGLMQVGRDIGAACGQLKSESQRQRRTQTGYAPAPAAPPPGTSFPSAAE